MERNTKKSGLTRGAGSILILATALCAACASQSPARPNSAQGQGHEGLSAFIRAQMKEKKIPGLAISVSDSSGVLWSQGYGLARKSGRIAFSERTISNVGSVSKVFTATAIMKLEEAGKLDLDAPLSSYLKGFQPQLRGTRLEDITVRRLLSHHSGLSSDNFSQFMLGQERPENYPRLMDQSLAAANALIPVRAADAVFSYSNLGYSLLGLVVEELSGMSFNDYVQKEICAPLGMEDSSFLIQDEKLERYALGYLGGKESFIPYIRDMSAGSFSSTAVDMGRFLSSYLAAWKGGAGILRQESVIQMFSAQNHGVALDLDFSVGLCWWIVDFQTLSGELALGHGGDLPPYHAISAILPERDLAVHIQVNGVEGIGSFSLSDILSEAFKEFAANKGQKPFAPPRREGPLAKPAQLPPALAAELEGFYATPMGLCQVKRSGGALKAQAFGQWLDLSYRADGSFSFGVKILGIPLNLGIFKEIYASHEILKGKPALNLRVKGIFFAPGLRVEPSEPGPLWRERFGSYVQMDDEPDPLFQGLKLGMKQGFFCASLKSEGQWSHYPLRVVSDSEAVFEGQGRNLGEYLQASVVDGQLRLSLQGIRYRKK